MRIDLEKCDKYHHFDIVKIKSYIIKFANYHKLANYKTYLDFLKVFRIYIRDAFLFFSNFLTR